MTETTKFWIKVIIYGLTKVHPAIKKMEAYENNGEKDKEFALATKTVQGWSEYCLKVAECNLKVNGLEKIPTDRPVLFVPNHQSYADIPILLYALKDYPFGFVVRKTMANMPFIKQLFRHFNCVPIDVTDVRQSVEAINKTAENINNGYSMAIFPEGRRTFSNTPEPFKNGAFKIAKKTGVTIVPVYLHNVHRMFEGNGHQLGKGVNASVNILDPINTEGMTRSDVNTLNEKVYDMILNFSKNYTE